MSNALKFKNTQVPRQNGEQARLKVVQGPDYGSIYVITGKRATIGRGEDNDLVISDLKSSRRHGEFSLGTKPGEWLVKDAGSANGILINGKATRTGSLKTGDTVTFGETTLEYVHPEAGTVAINAPARNMLALRAEQVAFSNQQKQARTFGPPSTGSSGPGLEGLLKNKKVLGIAVAAAVVIFFLGDTSSKTGQKSAKNTVKEDRTLASYLPDATGEDNTVSGKAADTFFRAGFREFREKNYLRAKVQFETVLQVAPGHVLATLYLENCEKAIQDEVKFNLERGSKSMEAGKLKSAQGHFQAVLRLLNRDQTNPNFSEAKDQLEKVEKIMKGGTT